MTKKTIKILSIIIVTALFGLISILVYWGTNLIQVTGEYFNSRVSESVENINIALNKREIGGKISLNSKKTKHRDISERIPSNFLDSLIGTELKGNDIISPFEWGIYSVRQGKIIIHKHENFDDQIMESPHYYRIYPEENKADSYFLSIYFPNKNEYLLRETWYIVLITFILLLTLIITISHTLMIITRQKKLSELKNDFINHITHEFKTPISTIKLVCEAIQDRSLSYDNKQLQDMYTIIESENRRLESLSEQIIEISRLEKGELFVVKSDINLHHALNTAINNIEYQVSHKNGKIICKLEAENPIIYGDLNHISHIISNLIDNANKYSIQAPQIIIKTKNIDQGIELSVNDNGIGISKQNTEKIFEKLYRVPTGNLHNIKGFGLGLSYVKSIMDKHQGHIRVESELKKGTTIRLYFPQNHGHQR